MSVALRTYDLVANSPREGEARGARHTIVTVACAPDPSVFGVPAVIRVDEALAAEEGKLRADVALPHQDRIGYLLELRSRDPKALRALAGLLGRAAAALELAYEANAQRGQIPVPRPPAAPVPTPAAVASAAPVPTPAAVASAMSDPSPLPTPLYPRPGFGAPAGYAGPQQQSAGGAP